MKNYKIPVNFAITYRVLFMPVVLKIGPSPDLKFSPVPRILDTLEGPLDFSVERDYPCTGQEL